MRKFFAVVFFTILVFPLLFGAQIAVSMVTWTLDRDFYIDALNQPGVAETLTAGPFFEQALSTQFRLPPDADTSALENVFDTVLSPDFIKEQITAYVNGLFDYLQGRTHEFAPTIDITPLKVAISGEKQDEFLRALVTAMPVCAPGQTPGFGSDTTTACKPAGVSDDVIIESSLKPAIPIVLSQLPDELPLQGDLALVGTDMSWRSYVPGMAAPASIMLGLIIFAFVALTVWYIIALIADSAWSGRFQWMGWTLLIPSLLVFLLGFATLGGVASYWINFGLERADLALTPFGPALADTLQTVTLSVLPRVSNAFKMVGGICGAIALAFVFWGIATPRSRTS